MDLQKFQYRSAIALNNWGVELLARGHFAQARQTIRGAVALLKVAAEESNQAKFQDVDCDTIESQLQRAARLLSSPHRTPGARRIVHVLSHDCTSWEHEVANLMKSNPSLLIALRIEKPDYADVTDLDVDLVTACVVYNCGISYACLASLARKESTGEAIKMRTTAAKVIARACQLVALASTQLDGVFVAIVLFTSLERLLPGTGEELVSQAKEFTDRLQELRKVAAIYNSTTSELIEHPSAAA